MEQTNNNPRTQGFKEGTRKPFSTYKEDMKASGHKCVLRDIKERVDSSTGEVIPAHKALCFFLVRRDSEGNPMKGANGGFIAQPDSLSYVNIGPSVEGLTAKEISEQADALEVGELQSGTMVLYRPNYNGLEGEEIE